MDTPKECITLYQHTLSMAIEWGCVCEWLDEYGRLRERSMEPWQCID